MPYVTHQPGKKEFNDKFFEGKIFQEYYMVRNYDVTRISLSPWVVAIGLVAAHKVLRNVLRNL